ncbi:hypothetical protein KQH50_00245 [bacterium]|nr:hypothetical protein [bacterium]
MQTKNKSQTKFSWPWYVLILALIFPLFLYANNLGQVTLDKLWRPVLLSALLGIILFAVIYLILRESRKAGLITALVEILVFSYGHIYNVFKPVTVFGVLLGRHRFVMPALVLIFGVLIWLVWRRLENAEQLVKLFGALVLIVFGFQVVRIAYYEISSVSEQRKLRQEVVDDGVAIEEFSQRDVYLIVLDTYIRSDCLEDQFGYDNSDFIERLEAYGFYVADCSRSNYAYTIQSMTSELNMDYLDDLNLTYDDPALTARLQHSEVRKFFDDLGYEFVVFESPYPWLDINDADQYISSDSDVVIQNFEILYLKTTLFSLPFDVYGRFVNTTIEPGYHTHVHQVNTILEYLQNPIPSSSPRFVYAHIISPHVPRVFTSTGQINLNWKEDQDAALRGTYDYIGEQILNAIENILQSSEIEPVIILQADHGESKEPEYRTLILNAYYLPEGGEVDLYPTISPVNTFRVVLNRYFGQDYPLLEDKSFFSPDNARYEFELVDEPYDYCRDQAE